MFRLWLAFWLFQGTAIADVSQEYRVKAAFLYNFAKFVQWPESRFAGPESPLVIGVLRANPFGDELEKTVSGRRINNRPVRIQLVTGNSSARQTHLLFVSEGQDADLPNLFAALRGHAVLTVGETAAFARAGGMITFSPQDGTMRFTINKNPAEAVGLKISAQLQKLSLGVRK